MRDEGAVVCQESGVSAGFYRLPGTDSKSYRKGREFQSFHGYA
jgi:hypothetical protein